MRIGILARQLGVTTDVIRFYEREGLLDGPNRAANGYREYSEADAVRLRLLVGLRQLDLPLEEAARLAALCADGHCAEMSTALGAAVASRRAEIQKRRTELDWLDLRLADLQIGLAQACSPRPLITLRKEEPHDTLP